MIIKCSKIRFFKYITAFLLFIAGISVTCELNIIEFQDKFSFSPHICFEDTSDVQLISEEIKRLSSENNVIVYTLEYNYSSLNCSETIISVFGNDTEELKNILGVQDNEFKSIFYNNVSVKFREFNQDSVTGQTTQFYIAGADDDIKRFVNEIGDIYRLSKIELNALKSNDTKILCFILWIIIGAFIISITLYEIAFMKKEIFLKRIFGETLLNIHIKFNISDSAIIMGIFAVSAFFINNFTNIRFCLKYLLCVIIIICLINSIIYITLNFFDVNIIVKDRFSEKALPYAYIFGFITSFLAIFSIIMAFDISDTVNDYTKIDKFVKSHSEYSICDFQRYVRNELNASNIYETKKNNEVLNEEIYREYFQECKPVLLAGLSINNGERCVYANIYSYDYLCENIKEFAGNRIESDIVIVLPKGIVNKDEYIDSALETIRNTEGTSFTFDYQTIEYEDDISIVYISNTEDICLNIADNPVVIYNSVKADSLTTPLSSVSRSGYNILYKVDDNIRDDIIHKFNMENDICTITNLKDYYEHWYFIVSSTADIIYFFCFSVIIAQIFVNISVITLTYKINSKELALKKVLGYSLFEKNRKLLLYNFLSIFISLILNIIIIQSISKVIMCSVPIVLITSIVTVSQIEKSEKLNVNNVFKGFM
ncbi:MAG: DUF1430 domain-containing protein [Oscillospiraceae bacterium]|nr:DUF1430 domain-containing protein [Oscillospiraceae bacterium]